MVEFENIVTGEDNVQMMYRSAAYIKDVQYDAVSSIRKQILALKDEIQGKEKVLLCKLNVILI